MKWEEMDSAPKCGEVIIVKGYYDFERREPMLAAAAMMRDGLWWRDNRGLWLCSHMPAYSLDQNATTPHLTRNIKP